jgi:hypothetical protein
MKYIKFENLGLVLFGHSIKHFDFAQKVDDKPISAGFVKTDMYSDTKTCEGHSTTLGIGAQEEDTELLNQLGIR